MIKVIRVVMYDDSKNCSISDKVEQFFESVKETREFYKSIIPFKVRVLLTYEEKEEI